VGVENDEADRDRDGDTDADLRGEPAEIVDRDGAVQEEAEEVADEQQVSCDESARAEATAVGAERQDQRQRDERDCPVAAKSDAESECRDHRNGDQQHRDELTPRGWVEYPEACDHADDRAEQHSDHQELVIGNADLGRLGGRQRHAIGRDLQGVGEMHEQGLRAEDGRDREHALEGHAQAVQTGV
jgi:hypothetical protein